MPAVSVVMAAYNSAPTIGRSIRSVLDQDFTDFELLVVDDNSSDATTQIVEEFCLADSRVTLTLSAVNGGAGKARNVGIAQAEGRYIAFLDSDDLWCPNKLSTQLHFMRERNAAFSCSWFNVATDAGQITALRNPPEKIRYKDLLKENVIGCLTVLYDTEILGKCFMPEIRKRQDYALWLQLLRRTEYCHCVSEALAVYTERAGSISSNKTRMLFYNYRVFREIEGLSLKASLKYVCLNIWRKVAQSLK